MSLTSLNSPVVLDSSNPSSLAMFRANTVRSARSTGNVEYVGVGVDGPARSTDKSRGVVASTEDDDEDDDDDVDSACIAVSRPWCRATTWVNDCNRGDARECALRVVMNDGCVDLEDATNIS